jgi:hypothetical protein
VFNADAFSPTPRAWPSPVQTRKETALSGLSARGLCASATARRPPAMAMWHEHAETAGTSCMHAESVVQRDSSLDLR